MSGQCLSASGAGRALTPARHLRLGGPSPHQLANITWAPPGAMNLCSHEVIRYYPFSRRAIPNPGVGTHALLPLTPVPALRRFPRLACLIHAANVRSEPGSNPSKCPLPTRGCLVRLETARQQQLAHSDTTPAHQTAPRGTAGRREPPEQARRRRQQHPPHYSTPPPPTCQRAWL